MKLDISNHVFPKIYFDKMMEVAPNHKAMGKRVRGIPVLYDLEAHFASWAGLTTMPRQNGKRSTRATRGGC
jgi:hypothetical protein